MVKAKGQKSSPRSGNKANYNTKTSKRRSSSACKRREARRERRTNYVSSGFVPEVSSANNELFYAELAYEEYCDSVYRINIDPFEECFND